MDIEISEVHEIERLGDFDDEYVYDIGVSSGDPYFFANDILVHNSVYFSVGYAKDEFEKMGFEINRDSFVELCDNIADGVNETFQQFCVDTFNANKEFSKVIAAGREICGTMGLFVKKKRYAINYYDKEGKRVDVDGKGGKLKIMGMETQRSDTSVHIQKMLKELLNKVLDGEPKENIIEFIRESRSILKQMEPWEKGSPKSANKITYYRDKIQSGTARMVPGHVQASLNWNILKKANLDNHSMEIVDGMKVTVCKLKPNHLKMTSVAFPSDQSRLPNWFTELPFNDQAMEEGLIDKKVDNLIGVLEWDLTESKASDSFMSLFKFED